jgi:microcystin-dependent protein
MTPDLAMIYLFASNFAPQGYALCNGQILAISTNTALFSLIGTYYGGNGQTNFALPDLRGRTPIHTGGNSGQGPGLSAYVLGQFGGVENVALSTGQMPSHTHSFNVNKTAGTSAAPGNTSFISAGPGTGSGPNASALKTYTTDASPANLVTLNPQAILTAGSSQPHNNIQPYLAVNYVIALQGVFPSRN